MDYTPAGSSIIGTIAIERNDSPTERVTKRSDSTKGHDSTAGRQAIGGVESCKIP